jgi:hypothetical protein
MAEGTVAVEPAYVARLADALRARLDGAQVRYEPIRGDRYRFEVVWGPFDKMGHPQRQQIVWDLADEIVPKPDLLKVGMIVTVGPAELPTWPK